jgi:tetratricopeptide (TPR) repeat protein
MNARTVMSLTAVLAVTLSSVSAQDAHAQNRRLGSLDFPNSGAAEAQAPFIRGVLLLHSFEFEDAAGEFRAAQELDPGFALAYWGEAMTYNHPLWRQQDREAALGALGRFAATAEERAARAPTDRERAYLAALDVLYGTDSAELDSKTDRDRAYMEAMARLSASYPDDLEARAFHSLAILGSTDGERDFATYMRAAAVAQPVVDANPRHPGAVHYIIHSFDDPVHAPLGLPAARAYSGIAPDAGHAQHMTSHIFVAMGLWHDVVAANIRARDVQNAREEELGRQPNVCGHYTSWLHYGWLQQGQADAAEQGMAACLARVRGGGAPGEVGYFVNMRARHVLDTEDWGAAERLTADVSAAPWAVLGYAFIDGFAAAKRGDIEVARSVLSRFADAREQGPEEPRSRVAELELEALVMLADGDADAAVELLIQATALEESLPFEFGPPASLKPPHELLGEVLAELGRHEDAVGAFRDQLGMTPERVAALRGLAAAAEVVGDEATAADARDRLETIRRRAASSSGG